MTKSQAPIDTTIITTCNHQQTMFRLTKDGHTVRYSNRESFPQVSTKASCNSSMPSKKMRAPTTITGMYPMMTGPTTIMPAVAAASMRPASREVPPLAMNKRLFVYTR